MQRRNYFKHNDGIALILVISVLAVMVSLVATFLVASRMATMKAYNFKEGWKASNIADAGIEHAKALLHETKLINGFDDSVITAPGDLGKKAFC